jgi:hypothetical protein
MHNLMDKLLIKMLLVKAFPLLLDVLFIMMLLSGSELPAQGNSSRATPSFHCPVIETNRTIMVIKTFSMPFGTNIGGLKPQSLRAAGYCSIFGCMNKSISIPGADQKRLCLKSGLLEAAS